MAKMHKSSVSLKSNIMLKTKFQNNQLNYLPIDLLPKEYRDIRSRGDLSPIQRGDVDKLVFYAKRIVSIEEDQEV